jgi:cytochrome o ubiquinol oxidase subunit 3
MKKDLSQNLTTNYGFWLYLMSDVMIFGALFACFMVLRSSIADGPSIAEIVVPTTALLQTIALLSSSFTAAMAQVALRYQKQRDFVIYMLATFGFGLFFFILEMQEFSHLVSEGASWQVSAAMSAFFALVGTHGLHILIGLIWLATLGYFYWRRGNTTNFQSKLALFVLFWHFLDLVWIWLFVIVYLFGAGRI